MTFSNGNNFEYPSRPHPPDLDRKPYTIFDEPDSLDDDILDSAMISPAAGERRDSFANGAASIFSPQSSSNLWGDDAFPSSTSTATAPERHYSMSSHFTEHPVSNNPFHQHNSWNLFDRSANSRTPVATVTYEPFAGDFETGQTTSAFPPPPASSAPFNGLPVLNNVQPSHIFPPAPSVTPMPTSPQPPKDWMAMAKQSSLDPGRQMKRVRQTSPPRTISPIPRRDGVRKKNARFEIPKERSLQNIDNLIRQCTDDDEMKELKQQKRLLRNRQAALDSRQRKKKHTENLEQDKKLYTERNQQLEDESKELREQLENLQLQNKDLAHQAAALSQQVQTLNWEKEDLIRTHTLENGELRKKINILKEKLETSPSEMPTDPSNEFTDFTNGLGSLTMGPDLYNFEWVDVDMDQEQRLAQPKVQGNETTLVVGQRRKDALAMEEADKPVASGLLFMLLLCGAFVASRSSDKAAPTIPRMPDEVRAASATILDSVLKDAGAPQHSSTSLRPSAVSGMEPHPSGNSWLQPENKPPLIDDNPFPIGANPSPLDALTTTLITPSKDQEAEALFSMTPAQYNSLTSTDFTRRVYSVSPDEDSALTPPGSSIGGRRNLAETLRIMREESRGSGVAEVYTRSLLWDKIPSEVVRDFKKMVEESALLDANSGDGGE